MRRWLIAMICLLMLTGCSTKLESQQYKVLTGELDMGMGLSASPSKLLVLNAADLIDITIAIKNKANRPKEVIISFKSATKLAEGYSHLDLEGGSYFVAHTENKVEVEQAGTEYFSLLIKERYTDSVDREIWLSLWESTGENIRQEMIIQILFKGRKEVMKCPEEMEQDQLVKEPRMEEVESLVEEVKALLKRVAELRLAERKESVRLI